MLQVPHQGVLWRGVQGQGLGGAQTGVQGGEEERKKKGGRGERKKIGSDEFKRKREVLRKWRE